MNALAKKLSLLAARPSKRIVGPIGLDFSLESLHIVQLQTGKDGRPEVRARTSLAFGKARREVLNDSALFRRLVRDALADDRFVGRRAIVAVPSGLFRTVSINFQSPPGRDHEAAAILKLMKDRVDGDIADHVLDYLPVNNRSKNDERLALVAVSERQRILDLLELLRGARLDVEALEIGPVAICRLVSALNAEAGAENVLVINSGRRASYLTLISGEDLLFDQEVAFGENALVQQVSETLDMDDAMARDLVIRTGVRAKNLSEADSSGAEDSGLADTVSEILKPQFLTLVEEIKRVCLYAAAETRGGAVSKVYLLGSVARWPGSDTMLSSLIDVDVRKIPNPLALLSSSAADEADRIAAAPEVAVATGLALRGMLRDG